MNNRFIGAAKNQARLKRKKNILISIVILIEIIAIMVVASYAWVETVSSIKITTAENAPLEVDSYYFTEAMIGSTHDTIDMDKYFKPSGDMHFAPCSSVDGDSFYFPKKSGATAFVGSGDNSFRKGNSSDKNTAYMSVTFKLRADTNADFFFYFNGNNNPTFSSQASNMRVSVTAYPEGTSKGDLYDNTGKPLYTKVYANSASTTPVVGNTGGSTTATAVEAFSAHKKGSGTTNRLFAVGANETKIVTINVWLQGTASSSNLSQAITITNFGITSSLTPRHVTLLPTPTWEENSPTYYAWCWEATNGDSPKLYKLDLDADEHYSFDYNGTYQKTTFVRAVPGCTVSAVDEDGHNGKAYSSWPFSNNHSSNTDGYWNQTVDTKIPADPVDPTYIIETISGGTNSKSTGSWHDPATIHVAHVDNQTDSWGTLSATSYIGTTTSTHVLEATNSTSQKHKDTVHAWPGKKLKLEATPVSEDYAFVGWYDNAAGTGTALNTNPTYTPDAPSTATDITYYAKFKEVRTLTIYKYLEGSDTTSNIGSITIGGTAYSNSTANHYSAVFDKGTSVSFSASAKTGYTLSGIHTTSGGTTTATSPVTMNDNHTYYAHFNLTSYNVTARACYSTNGGSSYTTGNSTGGTVKAGTSAAGATSTASVKYTRTVDLVATAASGYEFVGWYNGTASNATKLSSNATYTYTLNSTSAVTVYARFIKVSTVTIYMAPRENWGDPDLHIWDSNGVIADHQTAGYDGATGYNKVTVQTYGTWLKVIMSKDSNYTSQTSDITVVSSLSPGTDYSKFINTSNTVSNWSSTKRCIWFIITEDWLKNNLKNDGDYMQIWDGSNNTNMRRINDGAYVCEYSSISDGTSIWIKQMKSDNNKRNEWATSIPSGKSQYKETSYNGGSWQ